MNEGTSNLGAHSELLRRLAEIAPLLERLSGESGSSRPFIVDGRPVKYVTVETLSEFIPRSTDTLLDWAERGVIPAIEIPGKGGKKSRLFDLVEVSRALSKYSTYR